MGEEKKEKKDICHDSEMMVLIHTRRTFMHTHTTIWLEKIFLYENSQGEERCKENDKRLRVKKALGREMCCV